jgi:FKBP-type peptidyl-prolyl cis-trans isomerase FkpA
MKVTNVAGALCFALVLGACNNVDFKKTKGGMPYKVYASKSGAEIEPGNFVKVHLIQKIKDSVTYNTNTDSTMPLYMPVSPTGTPYDFSEILPSLKVGDSLFTVQVMDTFIARNPQMIPPQFKKGDKIETSIKVLQVYKTQEEVQQDEAKERNIAFDRDKNVQQQLQKDLAALNSYLSQNNIQAQKTGKGTHVQILEPGTGMQAAEGKYVSLKYTGSTFEGKVFDTNRDASKGHTEPLVFQVGAPGMIRGFDEGVRILKEGAKAKIYIPSVLAYGPQSPSPEIKPFENLIFDIEVLKVSDQPLQQQMGPQANVDTSHAH